MLIYVHTYENATRVAHWIALCKCRPQKEKIVSKGPICGIVLPAEKILLWLSQSQC
jgi:hypothetical protein